MWKDKQCVAFCFNVLKNPSNPCLCQRLISSRPELAFYNSGMVSFVIKPPLWWNYILVYFLVSFEYFSVIISFKLCRSLVHRSEQREVKKVGMISSPEKHICLPPVSSFSLSSLFSVRLAWHYLLEQLLRGTRHAPPPSPPDFLSPLRHPSLALIALHRIESN